VDEDEGGPRNGCVGPDRFIQVEKKLEILEV
jgi:hypothetical protein